MSQVFQVHRQERCVVDGVDVAQGVVELQAVQQLRAIVEAEDVVGEQVGVPVDDSALGDATGEQHRAACDEVDCQPPGFVDHLRIEPGHHPVGVALQLGQVLLPAARDRLHPGLSVHLPPTRGRGMEPREQQRHRLQVLLDGFAAAHQGGQPTLVGVTAHHDDGLRWLAGRGEVGDAQVAVGRQPAVEHDLTGARVLPAVQRREVQKVGDHRLLDLVGPVADEEDQAGVGLGDLRVGGGIRWRERAIHRCQSHALILVSNQPGYSGTTATSAGCKVPNAESTKTFAEPG